MRVTPDSVKVAGFVNDDGITVFMVVMADEEPALELRTATNDPPPEKQTTERGSNSPGRKF